MPRPDGCAVLRAEEYEVREIEHVRGAAMVEVFHYARGASRTATHVHGLFRDDVLVGVAMWLPPAPGAAKKLAEECGVTIRETLALSRLVVIPGEPQNAASFLLGRSLRCVDADPRFRALVTFADTSRGHKGTIYKATNWLEAGRKVSTHWIMPDGRQASARSTKNRTRDTMRAMGAVPVTVEKIRFIRCPWMYPQRVAAA